MIRTTPFHERVVALNKTWSWSHWAGHVVADRYQMSDKFEYFAVRNSAGILDTSPLYKYRIHGRDAEAYLAGVLARDIRRCRPGSAQYTIWCDDRGYLLEDGVIMRPAPDEFLLSAARPNLSYFQDLIGQDEVEIEDVTLGYGVFAFQGPKSREILATLAPEIGDLPFFGVTTAKLGSVPVTVSRTGYTGDLGYEVWVGVDHALGAWDAVMEASEGRGVVPFGQTALLMTRIEAGLLLIDVDFESSRFVFNDQHRSTPIELGLGWMFRDIDDRRFIGRDAIRTELAEGTSRWRMRGLVVDYADYDRKYQAAGLVPPKDHRPVHGDMMVYDDDGARVGYATSFMYSPILQRHIALARVRPDLSDPGTRVNLEFTIDHAYVKVAAHVARLPLFDPERKTA